MQFRCQRNFRYALKNICSLYACIAKTPNLASFFVVINLLRQSPASKFSFIQETDLIWISFSLTHCLVFYDHFAENNVLFWFPSRFALQNRLYCSQLFLSVWHGLTLVAISLPRRVLGWLARQDLKVWSSFWHWFRHFHFLSPRLCDRQLSAVSDISIYIGLIDIIQIQRTSEWEASRLVLSNSYHPNF